MRTTVVIDDSLNTKLKGLSSKKGLSRFINQCLREHFEVKDKKRRMRDLEKAYQRAAKMGGKSSRDFDAVDIEGWPEW